MHDGKHSPASDRTRVRRLADRGCYDPAVIRAILDEGLVCHVAFVEGAQPCVIPMGYARDGDRLLLHGSRSSRLMQRLAAGVPVCVTVTLLDGLVFARAALHHSMNYRSAVIFGIPRPIEDRAGKEAALRAVVEHVYPGTWDYARPPDEAELDGTAVVELPIGEASAKTRTGPPKGDDEDIPRGTWSGEIPLRLEAAAPIPRPAQAPELIPPPMILGYRRGRRNEA